MPFLNWDDGIASEQQIPGQVYVPLEGGKHRDVFYRTYCITGTIDLNGVYYLQIPVLNVKEIIYTSGVMFQNSKNSINIPYAVVGASTIYECFLIYYSLWSNAFIVQFETNSPSFHKLEFAYKLTVFYTK